jgi:acetoin utilization deacetylase AcuC-like enzyme
MRANLGTISVSHPECALHLPFPGHPDRPERLAAALAGAVGTGFTAREASLGEDVALEAIRRVHDGSLARRLKEACGRAPGIFDSPDNPISRQTYRAAWRAVAAGVESVELVREGHAGVVWVAVRPPGHHARRDRAMGFCFFNTVAIAAAACLEAGLGPVAIVDFDVHHGNGTQEFFWRSSDVFYLSVHRRPFYPGSGGADEEGEGPGLGFTRNIPLAAGADDEVFCGALAVGLEDIHAALVPQVWLVSAGFDAHIADPVGGMTVTSGGFGKVGQLIAAAADESPVIAVLEGGYDPGAVEESVHEFLQGLVEAAAP